MGNEWSGTLEDIVSLQRGNTYKSSLLGQPGAVLLGLGSIERNGGFKSGSLKTYGGESQQKHLLKPGDIYVSLKDVTQAGDLVGAVSRVPKEITIGRLTQDTVKLEFKRDDIPRSFVYWLLRTPQFREHCKARAIGTTNLSLRREDFLALPISIPSEYQMSLVAIFDAIESKIKVNQEINATLEAIIQGLYRAWFVDFEPVRANIENRSSESASSEIAKLFPSEFENGIPKGWERGTLNDISFNHRQNLNPNEVGTKTAYVGLEHMPRKSIALSDWGKSDKAESTKSAFSVNDILFGKLRPYFHKVVIAPINGICSTDILVVRPKAAHHFGQTLISFSSDEIIQYADRLSNGAKMPRINWADLAKFEIVIPTKEVSEEFTKFTISTAEKIKLNINENKELEQIRDSFLPRLIPGKNPVSKIENEAEGANE